VKQRQRTENEVAPKARHKVARGEREAQPLDQLQKNLGPTGRQKTIAATGLPPFRAARNALGYHGLRALLRVALAPGYLVTAPSARCCLTSPTVSAN
jgi:hypothetical protein